MSIQNSRTQNNGANALRTSAFIVLFGLLLAAAAYVRFEHINEIGLIWYDANDYLNNAENFPTLGEGPALRFQPTAHAVHALSLSIFKDGDYALKVANGFFDLINCLLLLLIGIRFLRSRWAALILVAIYAFTPSVVLFARAEIPHTMAATFTLLTFCAAYCLISRPDLSRQKQILLILAMGASFALGFGIHLTMLFLLPSCLLALLFHARTQAPQSWLRTGRVLVKHAVVFVVPIVIFGLVALAILPTADIMTFFSMVVSNQIPRFDENASAADVWSKEIAAKTKYLGYKPFPINAVSDYLFTGLRWVGEGQISDLRKPNPLTSESIYGYLLIAILLTFVFRIHKRDYKVTPDHILLMFFLMFVCSCAYVTGVFHFPDSRYLLNVFPLFLLAVGCWAAFVLRSVFTAKYAEIILVIALLGLYAIQPRVYPTAPELRIVQNTGKEVKNVLGKRINENNKILILPYCVSRSAECYLTGSAGFGDNVVHVRHEPHTGESLKELCLRKKVRFVYVSRYVVPDWFYWFEPQSGRVPTAPLLPEPDFYGRDAFWKQKFTNYIDTFNEEQQVIDDFLAEVRTRVVMLPDMGTVYEIKDFEVAAGTEPPGEQ